MFIAIYIDNLFLFGADIDPRINNIMQNLQDRFWMIDLSDVSYYLKMKIDIDLNKKTISLLQLTYLKKIFRRYDISNCKPAKIFISSGVVNSLVPYKNQIDKSIIS